MATDNFLTTKSVLGLAKRVVMCPPPEMITFSDNISWLGSSLSNYNQHQYADNISISNVINYELVSKLAVGQSVACQIKINGEQEILSLYLTQHLTSSTSTTKIVQCIVKGTTVLNDGKIAGVIFTYKESIISGTGLPRIVRTINCHIYIHNWGTI